MYKECIKCEKLGVKCDGPNFVGMSATMLLEWCKLRKAYLGISNAKLAELSNIPKGTVDRLLSGEHTDFKFETVRPLVRALIGGSFDGNACPDGANAADKDELLEEYKNRLEAAEAHKKEAVQDNENSNRVKIDYLLKENNRKNKYIAALGIACAVFAFVIITGIIVDATTAGVGFFFNM